MIRLKIILPLFIVLFAYSVMCEDLREVKRLGWLRARQNYQYNHPPLVETYDVPVIYDKVIDRASGIQKVLTAKSAENSVDEIKSKNTTLKNVAHSQYRSPGVVDTSINLDREQAALIATEKYVSNSKALILNSDKQEKNTNVGVMHYSGSRDSNKSLSERERIQDENIRGVLTKQSSIYNDTYQSENLKQENNFHRTSTFAAIKKPDPNLANRQNDDSDVAFKSSQTNADRTENAFTNMETTFGRTLYTNIDKTLKTNTETVNNFNTLVSVSKIPEEKMSSFEESKSIATDNIRSSVRVGGQKSYENVQFHGIINNMDSKNQNSQNNQNVTKISSSDASSHSNNASEFQTEDTVIEQMQSKPTAEKIVLKNANFKINDNTSQELKHGNTFTQPQRTYKNISLVATNFTNEGNVENTKAISTIESSSNVKLSAMSSEQQQHSKFEGSGDMFQTNKEDAEATKTEGNAEKMFFSTAAIKSNKRDKEGVRITSNRRKIVETSHVKPTESSGVKTITKQFTRILASTSRNQPIESKKEVIEAVESPFTSTQHQKFETVTTKITNNSEKEGWRSDRKHSRRIISGSITKPVETTTQVLTSYTEPKIKISERPVEASTFTLTQSKTETFSSGTNKESEFKSSAHSSRPTLIVKEVFVEKPVQYSVELTPVKSHQIIESKTESNGASWTSTESYLQTTRFHGDREPIVPIIEQQNRVFSHSGEFSYSYEGGDGTRAFSKGKLKEVKKNHAGEAVEGGFSYTDKDGNDFSVSYTADENGYRPVGAHLPTPPPIPIAIARALAYLATKTTPEPVTESTWKH